MRQVRPLTSVPTVFSPQTRPPLEPTLTVDLRDGSRNRHPSREVQALRDELAAARRNVDRVMNELACLIDRRENLKLRLAALGEGRHEDPTVVPWGFFDDDL